MANTPVGYFLYPFATGGDATPIPNPTQVSGVISYEQGYGPAYEEDLLTNPDAQPIGRETMNQLFFDITSQLQQYSQYGTPPFITSLQNGGSPFPYPQYARVYYTDGQVYENQVNMNTVLPGTDTSWLKISGDATGVLTGTMLDYAGFSAPAGYLLTDGSAVLRSTYAALMSVITQTQTGTTTNTMNTVTGLTSTAQLYPGMSLESANFPSGTTVASVTSSTSITTNNAATASGAVSIQFFNWGNGDGSTTFNVPLRTGRVSAGQGGTLLNNPGLQPDVVGQSTGAASLTIGANNLPAHTHPQASDTVRSSAGSLTFVAGGPPSYASGGTTGVNTTTNTPISLLQPTVITYNIIKT